MSSSPGTRPSFGSIVAGLVALVALIGLVAWLVLNGAAVVRSFFRPTRRHAQGREINDLYTIVFIIAAAIFFLVEGLIVWSVIRYRRRPGDIELPPQTHGHNLAEIVWTVVPTIIVVFLFFISWQTLNSVEATTPQPDLKVRAVAGQFQWTFEYLASDAAADGTPIFTAERPDRSRKAASSCRRARRPISTSRALTSSMPSTCRSSCSSRTSCRGSSTSLT